MMAAELAGQPASDPALRRKGESAGPLKLLEIGRDRGAYCSTDYADREQDNPSHLRFSNLTPVKATTVPPAGRRVPARGRASSNSGAFSVEPARPSCGKSASGASRPWVRSDRRRFIIGSDFLLDGEVTASYFYAIGRRRPKEPLARSAAET
jgi:hypothetical protein